MTLSGRLCALAAFSFYGDVMLAAAAELDAQADRIAELEAQLAQLGRIMTPYGGDTR